MATTKNTPADFMTEMVETQTKMLNEMVENAKTFTKDIPVMQETIEKGKKAFETIVDSTKTMVNDATAKVKTATEEAQKTNSESKNFFMQWLENGMKSSKDMINNTMNTNTMKMPEMGTNPMEMMNNMTTWMTNMSNQMQTMATQMQNMNMMNNNPMMNANNPVMQMMNNMNMQNKMQESMNDFGKYTKPYADMMTNMNGDWAKQMPNFTTADSFNGMKTMTESLSKFNEMWAPMYKQMQDGSFNMDTYKNVMKPEMMKDFMDKFFNFMPTEQKLQMEQMNAKMMDSMKQMSTMGKNGYDSMKSKMQEMNPNNGMGMYGNMMDTYTQMKDSMSGMVSPLTKLMEDNTSMQDVMTWNKLSEKMIEKNIKNTQLQHMMYNAGSQAMEEMAESMAQKVQAGESIESVIKMYQEYLNKGDAHFTSLFESDDYSKLMTEVSSLDMHIKMEMDAQMEKMIFSKMPVALRSEMDEVYKNIYDLKKIVRMMEKMMGLNNYAEATEVKAKPAPTAKAETAKKATPAPKAAPAKKEAVPAKKVVAKKAAPVAAKKVAKKK
jgi:polyhydroxyalkanoate synthase subunit PhaE